MDKQSEEQSAEHVDEQNEEQSAEHVGEQNEGQPTEPPPLISESIDHLKAGGGAESNLSNVLPLPLPEHYKKFSISDEYDLPSTAEQLFYSLNFSSEECSRIEHVTQHQRNTDKWYRQGQGRLRLHQTFIKSSVCESKLTLPLLLSAFCPSLILVTYQLYNGELIMKM